MTGHTLPQALERAAGHADCGLRLLDRRERPTWLGWRELLQRATATAGGLTAAGLQRRERVALIYPTGSDFFEAFFGVLLAGGVPVPLYPPVRLGRLAEYARRTGAMLRAAGSALVLTEPRVRRLLGEAMAAASPRLGCRTLAELPLGRAEPVEALPDELALVQFSSGTTFDPKPVALSHRAVMAQVKALNSFWPDRPGLRHSGVSWLPLYHDMGLIGCVFPALERPSVLTLIPPQVFVARPAVWLRAIARYRATVSPAPNFAYGLCVEKIRDEELDGVDLSPWRVALNGAEPVAAGVLRSFSRRFSRWGLRPEALTPVYGLSEAALAVSFSDVERPFRSRRFSRRVLATEGRAEEAADGVELVSVGRPIPGFEVQVRDAAAGALDEGRVGRVWTRGPSLMQGYLDQPEATAKAVRAGWLDTGDLGFVHAGELYLTGRAKDVILVRGRNHAPEEIELPASELAGVRTGCVAAVSYLTERAEREEVLLFVERRRQANSDESSELPRACRQHVLSRTGILLDQIVVLEPGTLPRTSSGKIRRQETLRLHQAGQLTPPARMPAVALLRAMGRSAMAYARWRPEG